MSRTWRNLGLSVGAAIGAATVVLVGTVTWSPKASAAPGAVPVTDILTASANPSSFDQVVTYTATVSTSDAGNLGLLDAVQFQDNGSIINGCSFQQLDATSTVGTYTTTCTTSVSQMSVGVHYIAGYFAGDTTYAPASGFLNQAVGRGATVTSLSSPAPGASVPYGSEGQNSLNVMVMAVAGVIQDPSASVNIYSGPPGPGTYLCTAFLSGSGNGQSSGNCYLNSNQLDAGAYSLTAVYSGDGNFLGSTSLLQAFTVDQVTTQLAIIPVPGYAFYGAENGNFFIVGGGGGGGGNPTGYFTIAAAGISLVAPHSCSASNGGGTPCFIGSSTALSASGNPYSVTVAYPGDANFTAASATVPLLVFPATTSTTLTVSPVAASYGQEGLVNISATVRSGTTGAPTGPVVVQDGGTTVCTITNLLSSGPDSATGSCPLFTDTELPTGRYALTADYQGDGNFQSSISAARTLTIASQGYWLAAANGGVFPFGTAQFFGPTIGFSTNAPVVGIAATSDGGGYWEVASDGGIFAFGDARYYGSTGGQRLNRPIVGIAADPATGGYWLVASDGGIFSFHASFRGSTGNTPLNAPITALASTPDGGGYWEVASDGGLFALGDAPYLGSMGGRHLNRPIVSMAATRDGAGYRLVASDGGIFTFGAAQFGGSTGAQPLVTGIVGTAAS
jgi:hypothetical protein